MISKKTLAGIENAVLNSYLWNDVDGGMKLLIDFLLELKMVEGNKSFKQTVKMILDKVVEMEREANE